MYIPTIKEIIMFGLSCFGVYMICTGILVIKNKKTVVIIHRMVDTLQGNSAVRVGFLYALVGVFLAVVIIMTELFGLTIVINSNRALYKNYISIFHKDSCKYWCD